MKKIIDFYFFSGTGNTLLVVKKMKEVFENHDIKVNLYRIEKTKEVKFSEDATLGLGFPVAAQSTYKFVWDFIEKLPNGEGREVFMVDTLMMYSGGIVGPLKKKLEEKGYTPIGAKEIKMPNNLLPRSINEEKNKKIVEKGLAEAEKYALSLIEGKAEWKGQTVFGDLIYAISRSDTVWQWIASEGKKVYVDKSLCKKCKLCVELCPVGNITMEEYPKYDTHCSACMRCISFCPTGAVKYDNKKIVPYKAVSAGEILAI